MDADLELEEGTALSEEDLADEVLAEGTALAEGQAPAQRVLPPVKAKRGALQEDGTVRIAIMRPCVSRGKRIRGLPPIYTPQMLAENAGVFSDVPMYVGHLHPLLQEKLRQIGRSPADLGGRVVRSWFDPELVFEDDAQWGYRKGGIVGDAIPYALAEAILSRDPHGLHTSINAWPKSATVGRAPWNQAQKGVLIEGIRRSPIPSVDWVVRGGAGGRVDPRSLSEGEQAVITILESCYGSAAMGAEAPDFTKMTADDFAGWLRENREDLVEALPVSLGGGKAGGAAAGGGDAPSSLAELNRRIDAQDGKVAEAIAKSEGEIEKKAEQKARAIVEADRLARARSSQAHKLIQEAEGLTPGFKAELKARYSVLPSGPADGLLTEAEVVDGVETKSSDEVFEQNVKDAIEHYATLLRESQPGPRVRGQGGSGGDPTTGGSKTGVNADDPLVEFLTEGGGIELGDDKAKHPEKVIEALAEAATL